MELNLCAVVTFYHPEQKTFDNIKSYLPFVGKLYIMDNTNNKKNTYSEEMDMPYKFNGDENKIVYLQSVTNLGISKAINIAVGKAKVDGFSHILLMDQDSAFDKSQIEVYLKFIVSDMESGKNFDLYGPTREENKELEVESGIPIMTSGSIVSIDQFLDVGGYNEKLFIDEVDHEFSLRFLDAGYKIKKFGSVKLKHILGKEIKAGGNFYRNYPPFRYYYFSRNYFYLKRYYSQNHLNFILKRRRQLLIKIRNVLKYDRNRIACISYILLGWLHSKLGLWGKGISF